MKLFTAKSMLTLLALGFLTICGTQKAMAGTVTLELSGVGGNSAGGYDAYPYYFSVNGGPATTSLMCLSFNNEIYFGETWTADVYTGTTIPASYFTSTGFTQTEVDEAALLLNDANLNPGNADPDQLAAWSLFSNNVPMTSAADTQLAFADAFATANPNDPSVYGKFLLYVPEAGTQSEGGYPQTFIGEFGSPIPNTVTPEPSSMILLGSGLFSCAGAMLRKRRHSLMNQA